MAKAFCVSKHTLSCEAADGWAGITVVSDVTSPTVDTAAVAGTLTCLSSELLTTATREPVKFISILYYCSYFQECL